MWFVDLEDTYYFQADVYQLRRVPFEPLPESWDEWPVRRLRVQGVEVVLEAGTSDLHILVRGTLPRALIATLVEDLRENIHPSIGRPYRVIIDGENRTQA